jgi:uncharacterized LabA/DUF88 family protein
MAKNVAFVVDGFNMYYSLRRVEELTRNRVKWLDLRTLLSKYLQPVRDALGERVEISRVYYFSALATHLTSHDRDVVNRHLSYISALESTGVQVVLSRFKQKDISCPKCHHQWKRHEEKETDVALGVKIIEVLARNEGDAVVVITGDTDLIPAIRTAQGLFPHRKIGVGFPFMRHSADLERIADFAFKIGQKELQRSQFAPELKLPDGSVIRKPATW